MKCEVCGNDYDKAFTVLCDGQQHTFDSLECAIHALAPTCEHCGCHIVGHGVEQDGAMYCCAHCAHQSGALQAGASQLIDLHDRDGNARADELVTEASRESFPASDAPAWAMGRE